MSTIFEDFKCDWRCKITASHLPYNRNGFKYFSRNGGLNKEDIAKIIKTPKDTVMTCHAEDPGHAASPDLS